MPGRQPSKFLWLYALAWAGGAVAYVPFLTILLPVRVAAMTGEQRIHWLAYMTFFGAIAASVGGILFGWLSDRSGSRRPWIVAGLALTVLLMLSVPFAREPQQLLVLIVFWQLALNMMLAPLAAWAADLVPPSQLGSLGGLLALSPALGSAAGAVVTIPGLAGADGRLALVVLMVTLCVIPALAFGRPRPGLSAATRAGSSASARLAPRTVSVAMWVARCLVQISEATLFAYLYYYFKTIDPARDAGWIARLFGLVLCTAVPAALVIGRWSDRQGRPMLPLVCSALALGAALIWMAVATGPAQATAGYILFGFASTNFLSLHSAQTFRVLGRPDRRGRDLGVFNLTNTVPSLIMPWLTIGIVPAFGFPALFVLLASLAFAAALILMLIAPALDRSGSLLPQKRSP